MTRRGIFVGTPIRQETAFPAKTSGSKRHNDVERKNVKTYDYAAEMRKDVDEFIKESEISGCIDDDERQCLEADMFASDSVTGNASGSYAGSSMKAEERVRRNLGLLAEAVKRWNDEHRKETENDDE